MYAKNCMERESDISPRFTDISNYSEILQFQLMISLNDLIITCYMYN